MFYGLSSFRKEEYVSGIYTRIMYKSSCVLFEGLANVGKDERGMACYCIAHHR